MRTCSRPCAGSVLIDGLSSTMRDERVGLIHPAGATATLQTEQEAAFARRSALDGPRQRDEKPPRAQ